VREVRRDLDLAHEAITTERGRNLRPQDLYRDARPFFRSRAVYTVAMPPRTSSRSIW
jgi:hypothetical protein